MINLFNWRRVPGIRQLVEKFEKKQKEAISRYSTAFQSLSIPDPETHANKNRFALLAKFDALGDMTIEYLLFGLLIISCIGAIFISIPIIREICACYISWTSGFVSQLPSLVFLLIVIFGPSIISIFKTNKPDVEPSSQVVNPIIWYLLIWPILVFIQVLPTEFPVSSILSLQFVDLSKVNILGYEVGMGFKIASITTLLIWFSLWIVGAIIFFIEFSLERLKRRRCPESLILITIALSFSKLTGNTFASQIVYGTWPDARLRETVAYELNTVIDTLTTWLPHAMYPQKGPTRVWLEQEFLTIADRFISVQKEILIPKIDSYKNVTNELLLGFKNLYEGKWAEFKSLNPSTSITSTSKWLSWRSGTILIGLIALTIYLPNVPYIFEVLSKSTIDKIQLALGTIVVIYILRLADPKLETIVWEILKKK